MLRATSHALSALALLAAIGCGDDGSGPEGSISISVSPTSLTLPAGSSGMVTVTLTRGGGFDDPVAVSVEGLPAGMTASVSPTPLSGSTNSATVTVSVGASTAAGAYTATVRASASGVATATTTLQVTVTPPTSGNIVWEFCNSEPIPLKFWRLSGGTWSEVAPTVVGNITRFSFPLSGPQVGVAFTRSTTEAMVRGSPRASARPREVFRHVTRLIRTGALETRTRLTSQQDNLTSPYFDTFVLFAVESELGEVQRVCDAAPTLVSKTFTVSSQGAGETGFLGYGGVSVPLVPQTTSYNLMVEAGTYDWLATFGTTTNLPNPTYNWTDYRVGRGEAVPGATVAIDRTGATAFTQVPFTITGGASGSFNIFQQNLEGARGEIVAYPIGEQLNQTGAGTMFFLAPSDRLSTDMNFLTAVNFEVGSNFIGSRSTFRYFGSAPPTTTTFPLPAAVPAFTVTQVAGAPVPTWSASGLIPTDFQTATSAVEASFQGAGESTLYTISATPGWLTANNPSNYTLTGPTLPGFLAQWAPAAPLVNAQVLMIGTNFTTTPMAGSVVSLAIRLLQSP